YLYAGLQVDQPITVQAELLTIGPARVWLNGDLQIHFAEHFSYVAIQRIPLTLNLTAGLNDLYLHGEMLGWREARLALGLRSMRDAPITTRLPLGDIPADRWHQNEADLNRVNLKQFAFPTLPARVTLDASDHPVTVEAIISLPLPDNVGDILHPPSPPIGQ